MMRYTFGPFLLLSSQLKLLNPLLASSLFFSMASLFSAVAQGVSGLINLSQPSANGTTATSVGDAVPPQTLANTEKPMEVDSIIVNNEQPAAGPSKVSGYKSTIRAASLPLSLTGNITSRYGYVFDDRMMLHAPLDEHPESPARIQGIYQRLREAGCLHRMRQVQIRQVKKSEALLVHSEDHWDKVQMIARLFVSLKAQVTD